MAGNRSKGPPSVLFTGQAEATIDGKSRLAIPAKFRARWDKDTAGLTWCCVPWTQTSSLRLYPLPTFEELSRGGRTAPSLTPDEDRAALDLIIHAATEQVDIDANNRIRLASWQVAQLGLPTEVVVLGAGDHLEIRSRESWQGEFKDRLAAMASLADRLGRTQA